MIGEVLAIIAAALWAWLVFWDNRARPGVITIRTDHPVHVERMTMIDGRGNKVTFTDCTFYPQKVIK